MRVWHFDTLSIHAFPLAVCSTKESHVDFHGLPSHCRQKADSGNSGDLMLARIMNEVAQSYHLAGLAVSWWCKAAWVVVGVAIALKVAKKTSKG